MYAELLGQGNTELVAMGMFAQEYLLHLPYDIGVLGSKIVVFMKVGREIIEATIAIVHHEFPIIHAQSHHIGFVKFPIEEVMLLLTTFVEQGRRKGEAIEVVILETRIAVALHITLDACHIAEGGHEVVEGKLMVIGNTCLDPTRPPCNKGHTYATLGGTTLGATQEFLSVEKVGIGTTFHVGAIVTGEDDEGVLIQSLCTQEIEHLAHIHIETRYHSGKLLMCHIGGIIA